MAKTWMASCLSEKRSLKTYCLGLLIFMIPVASQAAPMVFGAYPDAALIDGGTLVTIMGTGFSEEGAVRVMFGEAEALDVAVSDLIAGTQTLTCTAPAHGVGAVEVVVINPDDSSAALATLFAYYADSMTPFPMVVPNHGPSSGGTNVLLTLPWSSSTTEIRFGSAAPTNVFVHHTSSGNFITCTTPPQPEGIVNVLLDWSFGGHLFSYTSSPAPVPLWVLPESGPITGGTAVTIFGTNLAVEGQTQVFFDGIPATNVSVDEIWGDVLVLHCTTPVHPYGPATVSVRNPDGLSGMRSNGYAYTLGISEVAPNIGPVAGGTLVTVRGSGFATSGTVAVKFGGLYAANVVVQDATQLTCTTPARAAGSVNVQVINPDSSQGTLTGGYAYVAVTPPSVFEVSPNAGPTAGGTPVTIHGRSFDTSETVVVRFGGSDAANVVVQNAAQLTCDAPAHGAGHVDVEVVNPYSARGTLTGGYLYTDAVVPSISSIAPDTGSTECGTSLRIDGEGFAMSGTVQVAIGAMPAADVVVHSPAHITCTAPAQAAGVFDVTVINPDLSEGTLPSCFTSAEGPYPTAVVPNTGAFSGEEIPVQIMGCGFTLSGTTRVFIGAEEATSVTVHDAGDGSLHIACTILGSILELGPADVMVINPDSSSGVLAGGFTYWPMLFTGVSPSVGPTSGGQTLTISLSGHSLFKSLLSRITVGGIAATNLSVVSSGTALSHLTCTTPPHAAGTVDIVASINELSGLFDAYEATLDQTYTYQVEPPTITSITPSSGVDYGGTPVTIRGPWYSATGTMRVTFDGMDALNVRVYSGGTSNSYITCLTPAHAAGIVDVSVINPEGGAGTSPSGFTYEAAPTPAPTTVTPNTGSSNGGTSVTIAGTGFMKEGVARVLFGGMEATSVVVSGTPPNTITCKTPAHEAGAATVEVINANGASGFVPGGFTYVPPVPNATEIVPAFGEGGIPVCIHGAGFSVFGDVQVTFDGVPATQVQVQRAGSATVYITCVAPAHLPGNVMVMVANPNGAQTTVPGGYTYTSAAPTHVVRVDVNNSSGMEDGTTWATAFNTIQEGIDAADLAGGGDVWVAEGVYTAATPDTGAVAVLKPGVHVYGGFAGVETTRNDRNWATHTTTLDGEEVRGCAFGADNATLDGFTIIRGGASLYAFSSGAQGMLQMLMSAFFSSGAWSEHFVSMINEDASTRIANCVFFGHSSQITVCNLGYAGSCSPTFSKCGFLNSGSYENAVVFNLAYNGNLNAPQFSKSVFAANQSSSLVNFGFLSPCIPETTNCLFMGNAQSPLLNGAYDSVVAPRVMNCTFAANKRASIKNEYISGEVAVNVTNSILWNGLAGPEVVDQGLSQTTIMYSNVSGISSGEGNINEDPLFAPGTFRLQADSPCIDAGTEDGAPATDALGVERPQGAGMDMGAYEYVSTSLAITGQPVSVNARIGDPATFAITATGVAPLSYQWQHDGEDIAAAIAPTYSITAVQWQDQGVYTCVVTNATGSVTSQPAVLTVTGNNIISGAVRDVETWLPISGATVELYAQASGQLLDATVTGTNGTYFFAVSNVGPLLRLHFAHPDYDAFERRNLFAPMSINVNLVPATPEPPTGFSLSSATDYIRARWNANFEVDIAGYNLYRADVESGPYSKLNPALIAATEYQDATAVVGNEYWYQVTAVDDAGHESAPTAPASIRCAVIVTWIQNLSLDPQECGRINLNVRNATGISPEGIDIVLRYDPALIEPTSLVVERTALTEHVACMVNSTVPGVLRILAIGGGDPLVGEGHLFDVYVCSTPSATPGACSSMYYELVKFYDATPALISTDYSGAAQFCVDDNCGPGDMNGDGAVDSADVIIALRIANGSVVPTACQLQAGDLNGDGVITSADAVMISRLSLGLPLNPEQGKDVLQASMDGGSTLSLPQVTVQIGETVDMPVLISDARGVSGADFTVSFNPDPSLLVLQSVEAGTLSDGALFERNVNVGPGYARASMGSPTAVYHGASPLEGVLIVLRFHAPDTAIPGSYPVRLSYADLFGEYGQRFSWYGAITTIDGTIQVTGIPAQPEFSAFPLAGHAPLHVTFTDESSGGTTPIEQWLWDFGDGGSSTEQHPRHIYQTPGVYSVSLSVTSEEGQVTETKSGCITVAESMPAAGVAGLVLLATGIGLFGRNRVRWARKIFPGTKTRLALGAAQIQSDQKMQ